MLISTLFSFSYFVLPNLSVSVYAYLQVRDYQKLVTYTYRDLFSHLKQVPGYGSSMRSLGFFLTLHYSTPVVFSQVQESCWSCSHHIPLPGLQRVEGTKKDASPSFKEPSRKHHTLVCSYVSGQKVVK